MHKPKGTPKTQPSARPRAAADGTAGPDEALTLPGAVRLKLETAHRLIRSEAEHSGSAILRQAQHQIEAALEDMARWHREQLVATCEAEAKA